MLGFIVLNGLVSFSDFINIISGILIPYLLIHYSSKVSEKQMLKKNEMSETQIKVQNELSIKKEKRMLATQIRLSKYEELYKTLDEYFDLIDRYYTNTARLLEKKIKKKKEFKLNSNLFKLLLKKVTEIQILLIYCPDIEDSLLILERYFLDIKIIHEKLRLSDLDPNTLEFKYYLKIAMRLKTKFNIQCYILRREIEDATLKIINDLED